MNFQNIFGRAKTPEEHLKAWNQRVREETRAIDKQIREIETQEVKVKQEIRIAAKREHSSSALRTLALELVRSKKVKERLLTGKAQLNSISMQLKEQVSMLKVTGTLQKSSQIMKSMNSLVKLPQIHSSMQEMSKEMMKAGLISEMMEEAIDFGDEIEEDEVEDEVNKVIDAVTTGILTRAKTVPSKQLPKTAVSTKAQQEEDKELNEMKAKLQSLK